MCATTKLERLEYLLELIKSLDQLAEEGAHHDVSKALKVAYAAALAAKEACRY